MFIDTIPNYLTKDLHRRMKRLNDIVSKFDPIVACTEADMFLAAADRCMEQRQLEGGVHFDQLVQPSIVCAVYALEVCLKCLYFQDKGVVSKLKHNVPNLFQDLDKNTQLELMAGVGADVSMFEVHLSQIGTAFVDWRYTFQDPKWNRLNLPYLKKFAKVAHTLAKRRLVNTTAAP